MRRWPEAGGRASSPLGGGVRYRHGLGWTTRSPAERDSQGEVRRTAAARPSGRRGGIAVAPLRSGEAAATSDPWSQSTARPGGEASGRGGVRRFPEGGTASRAPGSACAPCRRPESGFRRPGAAGSVRQGRAGFRGGPRDGSRASPRWPSRPPPAGSDAAPWRTGRRVGPLVAWGRYRRVRGASDAAGGNRTATSSEDALRLPAAGSESRSGKGVRSLSDGVVGGVYGGSYNTGSSHKVTSIIRPPQKPAERPQDTAASADDTRAGKPSGRASRMPWPLAVGLCQAPPGQTPEAPFHGSPPPPGTGSRPVRPPNPTTSRTGTGPFRTIQIHATRAIRTPCRHPKKRPRRHIGSLRHARRSPAPKRRGQAAPSTDEADPPGLAGRPPARVAEDRPPPGRIPPPCGGYPRGASHHDGGLRPPHTSMLT